MICLSFSYFFFSFFSRSYFSSDVFLSAFNILANQYHTMTRIYRYIYIYIWIVENNRQTCGKRTDESFENYYTINVSEMLITSKWLFFYVKFRDFLESKYSERRLWRKKIRKTFIMPFFSSLLIILNDSYILLPKPMNTKCLVIHFVKIVNLSRLARFL